MKPATSITKVCSVLGAFRLNPEMGIRELSGELKLAPSDIHRILKSLELYNYIEQDPHTRKYRLGLELLKLGHLVHSRLQLSDIARPFMRQLSEVAQATVNLAILDLHERDCIFVDQIDSPIEVQIRARMGGRASPHATAVGKVLTAFQPPSLRREIVARYGLFRATARTITDPEALEREYELVRAKGYATDRGEALEGAYCVGAPVRDHRGELAAAVSISMLMSRLGRSEEERLAAAVKSAASRISAALGYQDGTAEPGRRNRPARAGKNRKTGTAAVRRTRSGRPAPLPRVDPAGISAGSP